MLLWLAWGVTGITVFSFANRSPAHYVEAFAPALAVLAARALRALWRLCGTRPWVWALLLFVLGAYGVLAALSFRHFFSGTLIAGGVVVLAMASRLFAHYWRPHWGPVVAIGTGGLLFFLLVPSVWIALFAPRGGQITTPNPLFYAASTAPPSSRQVPVEGALAWTSKSAPTRYALAIDGFNSAGEVVAVSGAAVLTFWNEYFRQALLSPQELQQMVQDKEVRYFLVSVQRLATFLPEHRVWLQSQCENGSRAALMPPAWTLWDCAP